MTADHKAALECASWLSKQTTEHPEHTNLAAAYLELEEENRLLKVACGELTNNYGKLIIKFNGENI